MAARRKEEWAVPTSCGEVEVVVDRADSNTFKIAQGEDRIWIAPTEIDSLIDALTQAQAAYAEGA